MDLEAFSLIETIAALLFVGGMIWFFVWVAYLAIKK